MIRGPVDAVVCDMDGVLYRGETVIPGAAGAVARLVSRGVRVLFCTNNSRWTLDHHIARLAGFGIDASYSDIVTSAVVTGDVLAARGMAGKRAFVVGGEGLRDAVTGAGLALATGSPADVVVVGWDPAFDYDAMATAADIARGGALFIASNDDATFPAADGLLPGAGSILASIEKAAGHRAEVLGKPQDPMLDAIERRIEARRIVAVGDRPETDLSGAHRRGWQTVLVLSGVTNREEARHVDPAPDAVIDSIADLDF